MGRGAKPVPGVSLTLHERLADATVESMASSDPVSRGELMRRVGYSSTTAKDRVARTFSSKAFLDALAARGVTQDKISKVFDDAMKANVVTVFKGQARESNVPDHKLRLQAVDKLGDFTGQKKKVVESRTVKVDLTGDDLRKSLGFG